MLPDIHNLPHAQSWALNTGLIGQGLILFGLFAFLLAGSNALPWKFKVREDVASVLFGLGAFCLFGAIVCLATLFANDQFEFNYVFGHSDSAAELKYKIAGIWAGQQGSFLLWACTSALFGLLAMPKDSVYRPWFRAFFCVFLATLCGILTYETPFDVTRINGVALVPPSGFGLEPSLENYWVIIHPPTIFTGFGSLTVAAAYGFAAMASGNLKDWLPRLRPWAILSTSILGIGLCMGGFWAYETLGWGGFWAWDPVENVSFVPWIFNIALIHGIIVQQAKKTWYGTNLILAGIPFFIFCYGTFLTRSGFLSDASVHSFAQMNKFALWILAAFVVAGTLAYYLVYAFRGKKLVREMALKPEAEVGLSREKAYASGVMLLCGLASATAMGMSLPFFLALMHRDSKVVEEPLFHPVVVWFFMPIMVLMAVTPFIGWRGQGFKTLWNRISVVGALAIGITGAALIGFKFSTWGIQNSDTIHFPFGILFPLIPWITFLVGLCIWVIVANTWRLVETYRRSAMSVGGFVAHVGLAILMAGLILSRGFESKEHVEIEDGVPSKALDYNINYVGMSSKDEDGLFKSDNKVNFELSPVSNPESKITASPGFYFKVRPGNDVKPMVWPYLIHGLTQDLYVTLYPPVTTVWEAPIPFKPGETKDPDKNGIEVTYNGFKMVGKPGGVGTKFVGDVTVRLQNKDLSWGPVHHVNPSLSITADGPQPDPTPINEELGITMDRIDPADHSADLQIGLNKARFPIDLFYKPMVVLVWAGAGIMTLGGLIAAFYRRPPSLKPKPKPKPLLDEEELDH